MKSKLVNRFIEMSIIDESEGLTMSFNLANIITTLLLSLFLYRYESI